MKKSIFMTLAIGVLCSISCSKSDDDKKVLEDCQTCDLSLLGETFTSEICDNGDGTITITAFGQEEIEDLDEGVTFSQFISEFEQFGATCN